MANIPVSMTNAALAAMFKTVYKSGDLTNQSYVKCPILDAAEVEVLEGDKMVYPMNLSSPTGIAPTKDQSRLAARSGVTARWEVSQAKYQFRTITWDYEAAERSKNNIGAYIALKTREKDDAVANLKTSLALAFIRGQAGDLGQLIGAAPVVFAAVGATATVKLRSRDDAKNFHRGQVVDFHSQRTGVGGTARGAASVISIEGVNLKTGDLVLKLESGAVPATTDRINDGSTVGGAGDFVYQKYTRDSFAYGLPELLPINPLNADDDSAAVCTVLHGVDRSKDPQRLAGYRFAWQGSFLDTISEMAMVTTTNGAISPYSVIWMSPRNFRALVQEATNLGAPPAIDAEYSIALGAKTVKIVTPSGEIRCAVDPFMVNDRMYLLEMSAVKFLAVGGKLISVINEDGLTSQRLQSDDGFEMQFRSLYQTLIVTPGRCAVALVPTLS